MNQQTGVEARDDGITSGSASRPARDLRSPQVLDVMAEAASLFDEPEWAERDRTSRTIVSGTAMRVTITAMRAGAELGGDGNDDTLSVHALRGTVRVELGGGTADLGAGQLATMSEPGPWRLRATEDALLLITVALGGHGARGGA